MLGTRTKFTLIVAIVAAVFALCVLLLMFVWLSRESAALEAQVALIAESAAYQDEYAKLTTLLANTETDRQALEDHILKENNIISFLAALEQDGRSLGLIIETLELNVAPKDAAAPFSTLRVTLNFEGGAEDVEKFLRLLEVLPYSSTIGTFTYTMRGGESGGATVSGSVSLLVDVETV